MHDMLALHNGCEARPVAAVPSSQSRPCCRPGSHLDTPLALPCGRLVPLSAVGVVLAVVLPERRLAGGGPDRPSPIGVEPGDRRAAARTTG
ncbi:hypothetical protein [Streptomyces sp. NPDC001601]|uniref:hypothetical protein n=1 Tax=Streptomyces sp. NPDC001601 TaxID=3364592 RepID=UPI0036AEBD8E